MITVETSYNVVDNTEGVSVHVGPGEYGPGHLIITTTHNKQSEEYFGPITLVISAEMAQALGRALLAATGPGKV